MRVLELNLATRPFRNNTLVWVGLVLALGLVGGSITWSVWTFVDKRTALVDLRGRVGTIDEEFTSLDVRESRAKRETATVDLRSLRSRTDKANQVIRWKAFSWTRLFNELESIQPNDVRMTSVHPVFRTEGDTRAVRDDLSTTAIPVAVEGIARNLDDFFAFERSLLADPQFSRVEPGRVNRSERGDEIQFDLRFLYDPATAQPDPPTEAVAEPQTGPDGDDGAIEDPAGGGAGPEAANSAEVATPEPAEGPAAAAGSTSEPQVEPAPEGAAAPEASPPPTKGRRANPPERRRSRGTN